MTRPEEKQERERERKILKLYIVLRNLKIIDRKEEGEKCAVERDAFYDLFPWQLRVRSEQKE